MRLVFAKYDLELNMELFSPTVLVIENPEVYSTIVESLWRQSNGKEGLACLSESGKILKLDKKMVFNVNPFSISCNDKKILNRIYSELDEIAGEHYLLQINEINQKIVDLFDSAFGKVPYALTSELDLSLPALLKAYDVRIDEEDTDMLERMVTYIRLLHQVSGVEVFGFTNLKQFLSTSQLEYLYQACEYEQVHLIDVEGSDIGEKNSAEKCIIVDKDLCVIEIN